MNIKRFHTTQGFYVKTLVADDGSLLTNVECPIHCGACCGFWKGTHTLKNLVQALSMSRECPYLGEKGCELDRDKRPIECTAYLCELAILAVKKMVTKNEINRVLKCARQNGAFKFLGKDPDNKEGEKK